MHIALDGDESVKKASQVAIGKAEGLMRCVCMYTGSALLSQYVSVRLSAYHPPIVRVIRVGGSRLEAGERGAVQSFEHWPMIIGQSVCLVFLFRKRRTMHRFNC